MAMFSKSMKRASRCSSCVLPAKLPPAFAFAPSSRPWGSGRGAREDPGLGDAGRLTRAIATRGEIRERLYRPVRIEYDGYRHGSEQRPHLEERLGVVLREGLPGH